MNTIIGEFGKSKKFVDLSKQIENTQSPISISGLTGVAVAEIVSAIREYNKKQILLVTYNEIQAKKILENIKTFEKEKAILFPKKEIVTYDYVAESKDLPYERIEALSKISEKKNLIIVTTIEALMQKIPAKQTLFKDILSFKVGDICDLEDVKSKLVNLGYSRYDLVDGKAQFSIRGDIVDISIDEKTGVRIELWGDEIDSIRNFSISSQRSISNLDKIKIFPAHEYVLEDKLENICKKIEMTIADGGQEEIIEQDIEQIKAGKPLTITEPKMTRFIMSLEEAVELVVFAFQNADAGDIMVQKAPACTIEVLAQAVKELFGADKEETKIIGIRHGEKMYETLLTNEECAHAIDMGNFYRVPCDKRDLNYDKYFVTGNEERTKLSEFNSNNTDLLNVEQVKEKLLQLDYIRNELANWNGGNPTVEANKLFGAN